MRIRISGRQIEYLGTLNSGIVTSWGGWRSRQRWHRLWSWLCGSLQGRCTCSFASPTCLGIICSAILARKAFSYVVVTKHSRLSYFPSLHRFIPGKFHCPLLPFSDLSVRLHVWIVHFLHRGSQKPSSGHVGQIQGQVYVRLFQLYPTSLSWHSSRHVENLQENSCCF